MSDPVHGKTEAGQCTDLPYSLAVNTEKICLYIKYSTVRNSAVI